MTEPQAAPSGSADTPIAAARSTISEFLHWSPVVVLLLYILGYIAANGHYARFELVKPTLVNARYLSAGLLFTAFAVPPWIVGFACGLYEPRGQGKSDRATFVAMTVLYSVLTLGYGVLLGSVMLVKQSPWEAWGFVLIALALGFLGGIDALRLTRRGSGILPQVLHPTARSIFMITAGGRHGILMMGLAYSFGITVYPWVKPHYGGSAVSVGYVTLKPEATKELSQVLEGRSLPLVDIDERFLYVIACRHEHSAAKPQVMMVPLDFLASAGIEATPDTFLAVPTYMKEHSCTAPAGRVIP
jgi:hypothetical protein